MVAERSVGWGDQEEAGLTGVERGRRDRAGGMWRRLRVGAVGSYCRFLKRE